MMMTMKYRGINMDIPKQQQLDESYTHVGGVNEDMKTMKVIRTKSENKSTKIAVVLMKNKEKRLIGEYQQHDIEVGPCDFDLTKYKPLIDEPIPRVGNKPVEDVQIVTSSLPRKENELKITLSYDDNDNGEYVKTMWNGHCVRIFMKTSTFIYRGVKTLLPICHHVSSNNSVVGKLHDSEDFKKVNVEVEEGHSPDYVYIELISSENGETTIIGKYPYQYENMIPMKHYKPFFKEPIPIVNNLEISTKDQLTEEEEDGEDMIERHLKIQTNENHVYLAWNGKIYRCISLNKKQRLLPSLPNNEILELLLMSSSQHFKSLAERYQNNNETDEVWKKHFEEIMLPSNIQEYHRLVISFIESASREQCGKILQELVPSEASSKMTAALRKEFFDKF